MIQREFDVSFTKVAVLGLGKVGRLAARLLHEAEFAVTASDARPGAEDQPFERRVLDVSSKAALEQALAAGCDDYDTKPVNFSRLLGKIGALIGKDVTT